jgi:D-ribose pyranose/furanose isomerase RbsD
VIDHNNYQYSSVFTRYLIQSLSELVVAFIKELANEIALEAVQLFPELKQHAPEIQDNRSNHLQDIFTQMGKIRHSSHQWTNLPQPTGEKNSEPGY